ncbi:MAG: homoserine dehydrogenase [Flavobacteriales bacterium]|nr:homoserine dehydrogenase [Flavobacteriales bacterium]
MRKNLKLGLFGYGTVGQGLYDVLQKTPGIQAEIKRICIKDPEKKRTLPASYFTLHAADLLNDPEINVVVELIDDAEAAYDLVTAAMRKGKAVVTANKKMVAEHLEELYRLQQIYGVPLLYEGAVCASIPILRNLEEYYDNDLLTAVEGIFNGSTNYILTKVFDEGVSFDDALQQAQENGFAETDPSLDLEGWDPKYKLSIILAHAFGVFVPPDQIFHSGIEKLSDFDVKIAKEKGCKIKLVANCKKIGDTVYGWVMPQFVKPDSDLFRVNNEYNAVILEGAFSERQFMVGKGAGGYPTGSAVLSDISALTYDYRYEYKKLNQESRVESSNSGMLEVYVRYSKNNTIEFALFESIAEKFESAETGYVVGRIALAEIRKLCAGQPEINIVQVGPLEGLNSLDKLELAAEYT